MKKYLIFLLLFGLIAAFIAAPTTISAKGPIPPAPKPEVEIWEWYSEGVSGEEIPMGTITTTPREWYQLKANGLKVDGATMICHGFDAGRYGWTGEIFRLLGDAWVKLPTTVGWVPTEEGNYMACAMAPAAGTYVLFGYFDKAKASVQEKVTLHACVGDEGFGPFGYHRDAGGIRGISATLRIPVENVRIRYEFIPTTGSFTGDLSGSMLTDSNGFVHFTGIYIAGSGGFSLRLSTPTCYFDWIDYLEPWN